MTTIDLQPLLVSDALVMRPLTPDDWEALYAVAADPLIWAVHPAHNRWQEAEFRTYFEQGLASGGQLVAVDPARNAVIGASRYDRARAGPGEIEIGWTFLARAYWGGATNAVMKRLMIGHALRFFDRAIFLIGENNIRSRRAIEKIGGVLTERVDEAVAAGRPVRHVIYAIDHAAFAAGPLSRTA
jgi:RimJ/RimL family protein N-acetyltransferase